MLKRKFIIVFCAVLVFVTALAVPCSASYDTTSNRYTDQYGTFLKIFVSYNVPSVTSSDMTTVFVFDLSSLNTEWGYESQFSDTKVCVDASKLFECRLTLAQTRGASYSFNTFGVSSTMRFKFTNLGAVSDVENFRITGFAFCSDYFIAYQEVNSSAKYPYCGNVYNKFTPSNVVDGGSMSRIQPYSFIDCTANYSTSMDGYFSASYDKVSLTSTSTVNFGSVSEYSSIDLFTNAYVVNGITKITDGIPGTRLPDTSNNYAVVENAQCYFNIQANELSFGTTYLLGTYTSLYTSADSRKYTIYMPIDTIGAIPEGNNFELGSFIKGTLNGIMDIEIVPSLTISSICWVVFGLSVTLLLTKMFAGK